MTDQLFDMELRRARRDRAQRNGPVLFLHERAFSDILERLSIVRRDFSKALLVGSLDPEWPARLSELAGSVTVLDPGPAFARAAGGTCGDEDCLDVDPGSFDLAVAIGTLDSVNDLPGALLRLHFALKPDSLLIGAVAGGETLPRLRRAMRAADAAMGGASPHVHPRIEPSALAGLLSAAGFQMPVVDIDRVSVSYPALRKLVSDLRGMAATNLLRSRAATPLTRPALAAAERDFEDSGEGTTETFELLHFAAWTPSDSAPGSDG